LTTLKQTPQAQATCKPSISFHGIFSPEPYKFLFSIQQAKYILLTFTANR